MERVIPYHKAYRLGYGIDVTKDPSRTGTAKRLIPEDVTPVVAQPNFLTAQFSFVESVKDVCDILGVPPEYALKVQARYMKNPVLAEGLKDVFKDKSCTVIFRVTFLQQKVYIPYDTKIDFGRNTENEEETKKKEKETGEEEIGASPLPDPKTDAGSATHLVNALEIGNELVIILKMSSPDEENIGKLTGNLKETLKKSRGILDETLLVGLEKFASKTDSKLKKKHYQDVHCGIHYASYADLGRYPADLSGMVKTLQNFVDKATGWSDLFKSGVSGQVDVKDVLFKEGTDTEKKGLLQAAKGMFRSEQDTIPKATLDHELHIDSDVDRDNDSFIVLASETDHMYYMRATLQSDEPEDSEIESFTSFALTQYPETSSERFKKLYELLLQVDEAVNNLQDLFKSRHFMCENRQTEGRKILASVQRVHMQIYQAIEGLDMINMPSEEFVEGLYSTSPLQTVNEYIENVMSKLPPGCDLDLLLIGKTGHGKSSTGNNILGLEKFKASASSESVTKSSSVAWANVDGRILKVVDTPGVCDTADESNSIDMAIHAISEAISHCQGGFHALLLVIRFGQRMTMEEKKAIGMLKCILGETVIQTHCICIITYGDNFETEMSGKKSFQEWCLETTGFLKDIFEECQFRCVLFNNKSNDPKVSKAQLIELVSKVDNLKSRGTRYTNSLFEFAQRQREQVMSEAQLPPISQEMMRDLELVLDHLKGVAKNADQRDKYAAELENLRGMVDNLSNRVTEAEGDQVKLLVETVFSLAEVIHGEIGKIADQGTQEDKTQEHSVDSPLDESEGVGAHAVAVVNPVDLQAQTDILQQIRDTQVAEQHTKVDVKVTQEVEREIKENHNCFPASSLVITRDGNVKTMEEVEVGDEVLVRNGKGELCFDKVYMFGHKNPDTFCEFIVLHGEDVCVSLSKDHLIFCERNESEMCLPAQDIQVEDKLIMMSGEMVLDRKAVSEIGRDRKRGLFAPFTNSGTVIVDGALVSCYVDVLPHATSHAMLSPVRQLYRVSPSLLAFINDSKDQDKIPGWIKMALKWM